MSKYGRLGKNTILVFIGNIGSKLIYLILLPFYTRWLSAADYGSTDLITVYATVLLGIVSCSIYESIFIFPKDQSETKKCAYFSSALVFGACVLLFCVLLAAGIHIARLRFGWTGFFIDHIWLILGMLAGSFVQQLIQQFVRAIDRIAVYSITGIVHTAGIAAFSFWMIPWLGVAGYVFSVMAGCAVAALYALFFSRAYRYVHMRSVNWAATREMLQYSIPMIPNGIMWFMLGALNRPILEHSAGLIAVGLFAVANRISGTANMIYAIFQQAWLISAIEEFRKNDYEHFYNLMLKTTLLIQILYTVALTFLGKYLVEWFTTPDYYSSYQYIPLLAISVLLGNVAGFVGTNFATSRKSKYYFYSTVWAGGASLLLNLLLIPPFSIWGACWSMLLSQLINAASRIKYSWRIARITNGWFYLLNGLFLVGCVAIAGFVQEDAFRYILLAIMLIYFGIVNRSQINQLFSAIKTHGKTLHR